MQNGTVVEIHRVNDKCFTVTDATGHVYTSKRVVLATGIKDLVPATPGLPDNWAKGIYWCPWCDGYEHRDQPMGLLATIDKIPAMVEEIRTLNRDIIAFVNGSMIPGNLQTLAATAPDWQKMLKTYNVEIDNRTITAIERTQDGGVVASAVDKAEYDKFLIHLADGKAVERGVFFTSFPSAQRSGLGASLGVNLVEGKLYANITAGMVTNVPGVYAVGDANSDGSTNVPHAMWSGKRAAVEIHSKSFPSIPLPEFLVGASRELTRGKQNP
jgi:thioredoxin reductase